MFVQYNKYPVVNVPLFTYILSLFFPQEDFVLSATLSVYEAYSTANILKYREILSCSTRARALSSPTPAIQNMHSTYYANK